MLTLLRVNGHDVEATQEQRAAWILGLASGDSVDDLAAALRPVITPLPRG